MLSLSRSSSSSTATKPHPRPLPPGSPSFDQHLAPLQWNRQHDFEMEKHDKVIARAAEQCRRGGSNGAGSKNKISEGRRHRDRDIPKVITIHHGGIFAKVNGNVSRIMMAHSTATTSVKVKKHKRYQALKEDDLDFEHHGVVVHEQY